MKFSFLTSVLISILILTQASCRLPKDRIGGKIAINPDTEEITPLNKEACLYLSYEALCRKNFKESIRLIQLAKKFKSERIIIKECLKTLHALTLLKQNEFENALTIVNSIAKVGSYKTEPAYSEKIVQHPLRKLRSSARQLKKCQPILKEYIELKKQNKLDKYQLEILSKKWMVTLKAKLPRHESIILFHLK